jgi:hypothetical protein
MKTKAQRKADAEPHLRNASQCFSAAKGYPKGASSKAMFHETAARDLTKANQILKGKTNV